MTDLTLPVYFNATEDLPEGVLDTQRELVESMLSEIATRRLSYEESELWYNATQYIKQIGVAVDPRFRGVETATGWGRLAVESVIERFEPLGVRMPNSTAMSDDLWDVWQANNMDEECELVHTDYAVFGCSYITVGASDDPEIPLIAVESPLTMTARYDARLRQVTAALRKVDQTHVVLYLPNETLWLRTDSWQGWVVEERDQHNLGRVPVVRVANKQRAHDRSGQSEITHEVRAIIAAACRTLLGLEVAREYYSAPQKYLLGVDDSSFVDADGNQISPIQAFMGKILTIPFGEDGEKPEIGQLAAYSPQPFTEVIDMYAKQMAAVLALPSHYLGFTTENPASAEAIASSQERLLKRASRTQKPLTGAYEEVFRLVMLVRDGVVPSEARRLELVWKNLATPSIGVIGDFLQKMDAAGIIPGTSAPARSLAGETVGLTTSEIDMLTQADVATAARSFADRLGLAGLNTRDEGNVNGTQPDGTPASG